MDSTQTLSKMHTFTMTPNSIVNDPRLSLADKGLALILHSKPDGWVFHTANLAALSSNGLDATKGALKRLEDLGYIKRRRKQGSDGKIVGMEITLLNEPRTEKPQMVLTSEGKSLRGKIPLYSNTDFISNTDINNKTDNKSPLTPQGEEVLSSQSLGGKTESLDAKPIPAEPTPPVRRHPPSPNSAEEDKDFDAFWAAYPKCERKSGKADCRAIWKTRKLSSVKDKLMIALEIDKASRDWTKDKGQYIPFPKTWLNKKRYLDIDDSVVAENKNVCATATSVNSWSVLTYDDVELGRATEWWDKFRAGTPASWSIRDDAWVNNNRDIIVKAEKL